MAPTGVPAAPAVTSSPAHWSTAAATPAQQDAGEAAAAPPAKRARREAAAAAKQKRAVLLPEHGASPMAADTRRSTPPRATAAKQSQPAAPATSVGNVLNGPPAAGAGNGVKRAKLPQASLAKQKSPPPWAGMTAAALAQEQQRQQWQVAALLPGDFAAPLMPALALPPADALTRSSAVTVPGQQPLLEQLIPDAQQQDGARPRGVPAPLSLSSPTGSQYLPEGKQAEQELLPYAVEQQQQQQSFSQPQSEHTDLTAAQTLTVTQPEADAAAEFLSGNADAPPGPAPQHQPAQSFIPNEATLRASAAQPPAGGCQPPAAGPSAGQPEADMSCSHGPRGEQPSPPGAGSAPVRAPMEEAEPTAGARAAHSSAVQQPEQASAGRAAGKAMYANGHATTEYALERPRRDVRAPDRMPVGPVDAHQVPRWSFEPCHCCRRSSARPSRDCCCCSGAYMSGCCSTQRLEAALHAAV